ncbi:MAG TPA: hypothetical protein VGN96_08210 [Roseococcus sp.]|jgi:hypothetical protein|nr:hypothetical protein [Roseococcus sp.]
MANISPTIPSPMSGTRSALAQFIAAQRPSLALTLCWNDPITPARARIDLRALHARLDRRLFGKRFNARPAAARVWFVAALENLKANGHAHLAVRVPHGHQDAFVDLVNGFPSIWRSLVTRGSHDLQPIECVMRWAAYATKDVTSLVDEWLLSDEFLPAHVKAG